VNRAVGDLGPRPGDQGSHALQYPCSSSESAVKKPRRPGALRQATWLPS
jgi:hypothetical protein